MDQQRTEKAQQRVHALLRHERIGAALADLFAETAGSLPAQAGGMIQQFCSVLREGAYGIRLFHVTVSQGRQDVQQRAQLAHRFPFDAEDQMAERLQTFLVGIGEIDFFPGTGLERGYKCFGISLPRRNDEFQAGHQFLQIAFDITVEHGGIIILHQFFSGRIQAYGFGLHVLHRVRIVDDILTVADHAPDRKHRHRVVAADVVMNAGVLSAAGLFRIGGRSRRFESIAEDLRRIRAVQQISRCEVRDRTAPALPGDPESHVIAEGHRVEIREERLRGSRVGCLLFRIGPVDIDRDVLLPAFIAVQVALEHDGRQRLTVHGLRADGVRAVVFRTAETFRRDVRKPERAQEGCAVLRFAA